VDREGTTFVASCRHDRNERGALDPYELVHDDEEYPLSVSLRLEARLTSVLQAVDGGRRLRDRGPLRAERPPAPGGG